MELQRRVIYKDLMYEPETGRILSNGGSRRTPLGEELKGKDSSGYISIKLDGRTLRGHQIAFLVMTGKIPKLIDHKNQKRDDNRWDNLREISFSGNASNSNKVNSNTGERNITKHKNGKYVVQIVLNKSMYTHSCETLQEAKEHRDEYLARISRKSTS